MGETLACRAAAKSAGPIPTSLYGVVMTADLLLQDSGPFVVRAVLPNLPNPPGYGPVLSRDLALDVLCDSSQ